MTVKRQTTKFAEWREGFWIALKAQNNSRRTLSDDQTAFLYLEHRHAER
jgi:hypothetical protein